MEDVLELYAEPLDEARPVVCMDELSKELHGQVAERILPQPGQSAKEDYEYKRNGTANVFLLLCPLLGWRHLEVTAARLQRVRLAYESSCGCLLPEGGSDSCRAG